MAFALLASLPPVNGLYSSFFPLIPYFFMGTAHQMVPGKSELSVTTVISCNSSTVQITCALCRKAMKIDVTRCSPHPGTFAVLSIMVGIVCLRLAPESDFSHFNATLNATTVDTVLMNDVRLGISGTLACLTAVIQVA